MDRNVIAIVSSLAVGVALRKESVDRNDEGGRAVGIDIESLSARRAWIEIQHPPRPVKSKSVALRKESVDRNTWTKEEIVNKATSLSARRAWIEMLYRPRRFASSAGRSPQGERG